MVTPRWALPGILTVLDVGDEVVTFPGALPAARVMGALAQGSFALVLFSLAFLLPLFPTGTLPSRHWRPVAAVGLVLAGLATAGLIVHPGPAPP